MKRLDQPGGFVLVILRPDQSRVLDWTAIGILLNIGMIEPLGAGYYALEPPRTMENIEAALYAWYNPGQEPYGVYQPGDIPVNACKEG